MRNRRAHLEFVSIQKKFSMFLRCHACDLNNKLMLSLDSFKAEQLNSKINI